MLAENVAFERLSLISALCTNVRFRERNNRIGGMEFSWKKLSNRQKTLRTVIVGGLAMIACVIWFDDIMQWRRGRGPLFLACCFIGFPLQALFYGLKWRREQGGQR